MTRRFHQLFWPLLFLVLVILWVPGLKYPILSDTIRYALLGESLWLTQQYKFLGESYAIHLPFHAFVSYPFVSVFGYSVGMKVSTLLAGFVALIGSYVLLSRLFTRRIALLSVVLLASHHAFVLMMQLGSADLLFSGLFLFSVWSYLCAEDDVRFYAAAYILAGLATVTRYNGAPLFVLFSLWTLLCRPAHLRQWIFWMSGVAGSLIVSLWFVRNAVVFGNPFHTEYTQELSTHSAGFFVQMIDNIFYYLHPAHNILPILLPLALYAIWKNWRSHTFTLCALATIWALTSFWWVQAMRFAFPGYPIVMGFAVWGLLHMQQRVQKTIYSVVVTGIIAFQLSALCLYSYGECNALFDRVVGILPANMGLTSEGFYAWHEAREALIQTAQPLERLYVGTPEQALVWTREGAVPGIKISAEYECGSYNITQKKPESEGMLFESESHPKTYLVQRDC